MQEKKYGQATELRPSELLRMHAVQVRRIAEEHGASRVRVFGSVARGEDQFDSDVDLLVALRPGVGLFDLAKMRQEMESVLGISVDLMSEGALKARDTDILNEAVEV